MSLSTNVLGEYFYCDKVVLCDSTRILEILNNVANSLGMPATKGIVRTSFPYSINCVVTMSENHLSIHTRADFAYAAVNLYTCSDD